MSNHLSTTLTRRDHEIAMLECAIVGNVPATPERVVTDLAVHLFDTEGMDYIDFGMLDPAVRELTIRIATGMIDR
jgi:hypothetical protein